MEGDGIHRKEIPEIPVDAMREAVINSFAHARYDLPVQHEIDIFSDRISIVNPGSFAKRECRRKTWQGRSGCTACARP